MAGAAQSAVSVGELASGVRAKGAKSGERSGFGADEDVGRSLDGIRVEERLAGGEVGAARDLGAESGSLGHLRTCGRAIGASRERRAARRQERSGSCSSECGADESPPRERLAALD